MYGLLFSQHPRNLGIGLIFISFFQKYIISLSTYLFLLNGIIQVT